MKRDGTPNKVISKNEIKKVLRDRRISIAAISLLALVSIVDFAYQKKIFE